MEGIAEKERETRLRWYEHVIRRDEGELIRDIIWNEEIKSRCGVVGIAEKVSEERLRCYGYVIRKGEGELVRDVVK